MKKLLILLSSTTTFLANAQDHETFGLWGQGMLTPENSRPACKVIGRVRGIPEANWDFQFNGDYDTYLSKVQHCFVNDVLTSNACLEQAVFFRSQGECNANATLELYQACAVAGWKPSPISAFGMMCSGGDRWWDFWGYGCHGLAVNMYYIATIGKLKVQLEEAIKNQGSSSSNLSGVLNNYHNCVQASTQRSQIEQCYRNALSQL